MIRHIPYRGTDRSLPSHGFTLVEISVVLVIIGLLVAGVLVAKDMIESAKIRATVAQYQEYSTALQAFRLKYDCLPGDCREVASLGFDAASAGDGDGIIGQCSGIASGGFTDEPCSFALTGNTKYWETLYFWYQLSKSGLIKGEFPLPTSIPVLLNDVGAPMNCGLMLGQQGVTPESKLDGVHPFADHASHMGWAIQGDAFFQIGAPIEKINNHVFLLTTFAIIGAGDECTISTGGVDPFRIYSIDKKLDDGKPYSGFVRAVSKYRTDAGLGRRMTVRDGAGGSAAPYCVHTDGGVPEYHFSYTGQDPDAFCGAAIITGSN